MRILKFRGKDINNGEWVYGGYHNHLKTTRMPIGSKIKDDEYIDLIVKSGFSDWNMPKPIECYHVVKGTVCQYTGFNDISGNEIYEGDVVHQSSDKTSSKSVNFEGVVVFHNGCWCIDNESMLIPLYNSDCKNEVKGNKFDK